MKRHLKKIIICIFLALCCIKGYGQIVEANRHLLQICPGGVDSYLNDFRVENIRYGPVSLNVSFSSCTRYLLFYMPPSPTSDIHISCFDANLTNGVSKDIPFWPNISMPIYDDNNTNYYFHFSIEGPSIINKVSFFDKNYQEVDADYACADHHIQVIFKDYRSNAGYTNYEYYPNAVIECKNDGGDWVEVMFSSSGITPLFYSFFEGLAGLDPHQPMSFRTKRELSDGSYSIFEYTGKTFRFLPQFQFPEGTDLIVASPKCQGENTTLKIPYEGTTNYTLTVKGPNDWSWGSNPQILGCPKETINGKTYYCVSMSVAPGEYTLLIENKQDATPCPYSTSFSVPDAPPFIINNITFPDKTGDFEIPQSGGKGKVTFDVSGSSTETITIQAKKGTGTENFSATLTPSAGATGYYSGKVTIELSAGTYEIQVTNPACTSNKIENVVLNEPASINFTVAGTSPSCNEANLLSGACEDGTITVSAFDGGSTPYTYQINDGTPVNVTGSSVTVSGLAAGNYTVKVSDGGGASLTKSVTLDAPAPITVTVSGSTAPTMACSADGTVTLSASGGTSPYSYGTSSTSLSASATLTGLTPGNHTVYVKDSKNCMVQATANVPGSSSSLQVVSETPSSPTCSGNDDGQYVFEIGNVQGVLSVSADVSAGNVTIQGNTVTITGLRGGRHTCTIRDVKDGVTCSMDIEYNLPAPAAIDINTTVTHPSEQGVSDGQITANVSGGTGAPFRLILKDVDLDTQVEENGVTSSFTFSGLKGSSAGSGKLYRITAYDAQGCFSTIEERLKEPAPPTPPSPLQLEATVTRPVSCAGGNDAIVRLFAEGGGDYYQYSRDNATWDANTYFGNLPAGSYTFYVKDQNNAVASATVSIADPAPMTLVRESISHVLCPGSSTGQLRFRVSGGAYPYTLLPARGTITESVVGSDTLLTVSELPAGIYTFSVRDSRNCTVAALPDTITESAQLNILVSNLVQPTCGWDNGSLSVRVDGGNAPYTYAMIAVDSGFVQTKTSRDSVIFTDVPGGSYRISITDNVGCFAQSPVITFDRYTSPSVKSCSASDPVCAGGNSGRVEVTALAGSNPVASYMIYNADSTYTTRNNSGIFGNLRAGNYRIVVYDSIGCRSQLPYPVSIHDPEPVSILIEAMVPPTDKGSKDGKIYFRIQGGNPVRRTVRLLDAGMSLVEEISGVNNAPLSFSVYGGSYYLQVIDEKDCSSISDLIPVMEPAEKLHLIVKEVKDALCKSQTGSIIVEGAGGWGNYRYRRAVEEQYSSLNRFENLYPGSYVITVMDRMGATSSETIVINEPVDSLKAEIVNQTLPTCGNNGQISVLLSGGTPPYRLYETNDTVFCSGSRIVEWTGKGTGAFLLHLLDANGCRFELEAELDATNLLHITDFVRTYPSTSGSSDGAISASAEGGRKPYTYRWTSLDGRSLTSNNAAGISNIPAGYYLFEVNDAGGCSAKQTVYLYDPDGLYFTVLETGDETAFRASNGHAVLTAGADIVTYKIISPSLNTFTFPASDYTGWFHTQNRNVYLENLESGQWFISGTTASGKQVTGEFEIKPFPNFNFGRTAIVDVSAPGASDGEIRVEVLGGGGGNTFVWKDSAGNTYYSIDDEYGSTLSGIPAGKYTVEVTDRYGNRIVQTIEVPEPVKTLQLIVTEQQDQSCKNSHDAYVVLEAGGGWGDYQFRHESGDYHNGSSFPGLTTGTHTFYVIDKRGSVANVSVSITAPESVRSAIAMVDNVRCKGGFDGRVVFAVTGGTAPYSFKESGRDFWQQGNEARNLPSGLHTFMFKDNNGCEGLDTLTVYVPEPEAISFRNVIVTHTTCGRDNGRISVSVEGGIAPYRYRWLDFDNREIGNTNSITDLKQNGLYRLEVTDANGCTQEMEQLIQPSSPPRILRVETADVLCYGESNGTARVAAVEPGQPDSPYTITWSNGNTGDQAAGFPKGRHSATIADENGCSTIYYFDIGQPDSLRIRFVDVREPHCYSYQDAYIHTETLGGHGPFTYLWSTGATTPGLDNIPKGDYWVRVTDANGCSDTRRVTLNEPPYLPVDLGKDVLMCPGNTHVIDGGEYIAYRWFTEKGNIGSGRYLRVTEEGHYFLEATTPDGCPAWGDIQVSIGKDALIADLLLASEAAVGDTLIIFELSNLPLDDLRWEYDTEAFERITPTDEYAGLPYVLFLRCKKEGIFNIELYGYSGGCYSPAVKQVEVVSASERNPDDWFTIQPLIVSLKQYPNPSNGQFTVELELREKAEVRLVLFEIASGICRDQRSVRDSDKYRIDYNLQHLNSGTYVLLVTAGNERKQVKLIIV